MTGDASTYARISDVLESWGLEVIERKLERKRNSSAAGCGSGRLANICEIELQDKVNVVFQMLYYIGYFYNSKGEEMWKEPLVFCESRGYRKNLKWNKL